MSENQPSEVLSEFARTMVTDFPIQAIVDRVVEIMAITGAGVTLISPGVEPRYISASNCAALQCEKLQTELDEGPGLAAYRSGEAISVPDVRLEDRSPRFVSPAAEVGLGAVFTLRHGGQPFGALDLHRDTPGELNADWTTTAQTLADVTTAYLVNAEGRAYLLDASYPSRDVSLHDALTGLPNRVLLMERLEHSLVRGHRSGLISAVLFVDLDRFRTINDTFGHRVGDEVLVAVAGRLNEVLRPGDTLARISGDEFVVLCEDLGTAAQADAITARLDAALDRPFSIAGTELKISASIGIAFTGPAAAAPEDVLHATDMAMYRAKRAGDGGHGIFDLRDQYLASHQAGLERDMHDMLGRGELHLDYQPIVATSDGHITGVEALLRWAHPSRGPVTPSVLVPLAEKAGLIPAIGKWVLERLRRSGGR